MDNSAVTMWIWAKVINVMIMEFLLGAKCVYENIKKWNLSISLCTLGSGAAGEGSLCREPDVTLNMSDRDLLDMFQGELQPIAAFTSGRLKVQGDIKTAMKLEELIKLLKKHQL